MSPLINNLMNLYIYILFLGNFGNLVIYLFYPLIYKDFSSYHFSNFPIDFGCFGHRLMKGNLRTFPATSPDFSLKSYPSASRVEGLTITTR